MPVSSPDGKWVAFFGSEHPAKPYPLQSAWQVQTSGASLCVVHRDGTARKALNKVSNYPQLCWLPDSQHLLAIRHIYTPPEQIQITEWDIATGHWRQVALLQAKDSDPHNVAHGGDGLEHFDIVGVSQNGALLYCTMLEFTGSEPGSILVGGITHLQSVDLKTGVIKTIMDVKDAGVDWREEAAPTFTNLSDVHRFNSQ